MAFRSIVLTALLLPLATCWTPIANPNGAYFTLSQSYPSVANTVVSQRKASTTFHGHHFPESQVSRTSTSLVADEISPSLGDVQDEEPKTSIGAGGYFANKLHNGFLAGADNCPVEKYALDEDGIIQYHNAVPKLEQFTLCTWARFTNHSGDHTLFTYSLSDEPREIQFWVANANRQSFISMAVHGQSLYRLNYPFKLYKWHHFCSSWNGKTGEWQLWVKAERVGRGFHNRLVNHKIDGQGTAFSGGASITGGTAKGHHVEITMLQLYKVALSAGKAHRDHKHHHVHHFDHNGPIETTRAPSTTPNPNPPQPVNPLLANGQIAQRVPLNVIGPQQPAGPQQATLTSQFANGQLNVGTRLVQQQLISGQSGPAQVPQQPQTLALDASTLDTFGSFGPDDGSTQVRFVDDDGNYFRRYKRANKKRGLVMLRDGSIVDDTLISVPNLFDGLTQFGGKEFQDEVGGNKNANDLEEEIREHDREPAEGEVQAVMSLCSKCQVEPFEGAVVLAWKDLQTITHNTLKAMSTGHCGDF